MMEQAPATRICANLELMDDDIAPERLNAFMEKLEALMLDYRVLIVHARPHELPRDEAKQLWN